MQFVTIAENKPYFQWQIELLIESFKLLNLQDNLHIFLIDKNQKKFSKNLDNHKNCYYIQNKSPKFGFNYYNFFESIIFFKRNNPDKDFCLIDTDLIITNFDFSFFQDKNIFYQTEMVKKDYIDQVFLSFFKKTVPQICSLIYFTKNLSLEFFYDSLMLCETFIMELLKKVSFDVVENDYNLFKYGLLTNIVNQNLKAYTSFEVVGFPQNNLNKYMFLSYKHDVLPFFNKKSFLFEKDNVLSFYPEDPFKTLCNLPDFPNCIPLKKVAKAYEGILENV